MRIVTEWKGNDAEIKQLMDVVSKMKTARKETGEKEEGKEGVKEELSEQNKEEEEEGKSEVECVNMQDRKHHIVLSLLLVRL